MAHVFKLGKSAMVTLSRYICVSFLWAVNPYVAVGASEIPNLSQWTRDHTEWKESKPGLGYFASHCSTLYDAVSDFYSKHPIPQQRRNANIFLSHSHIYARVGFFLTVKAGVSPAQAIEGHWKLKSLLNDTIRSNVIESKNITDQIITDDIELCQHHLSDIKEKSKALEVEFEGSTHHLMKPEPPSSGPLDNASLNKIWAWLKTQTSSPKDAPMPNLVIQSDLPPAARLMFEFPSESEPNNPMQISISHRTSHTWSRPMLNWAIGHELVHYVLLMRENNWKSQAIYKNEIKHHCNSEFMDLTAGIADLISDAQPQAHERLSMYAEIFRSCVRFPEQ